MRVLVTGATGFIGRAVVKELLGAGHEVTGLVRTEAKGLALTALGARVQVGNLEDVESLRKGAAANEGAIHLAFYHEIGHMSLGTRLKVIAGGAPGGIMQRFIAAATRVDKRAIETIGGALQGADRAFVTVFGTLGMTPGRLATEDDRADPEAIGGVRSAAEDNVRALAERGVRSSVVRLAPIVHGPGDRAGFASRLIASARKNKVAGYLGDGTNRWPSVHVRDTARLLRLALERGPAGGTYHGVAEEGIPVRGIAETIGRRLNVPVEATSGKEADKLFGFLTLFLGVDNPTSSGLTRERLGWQPTQTGLIEDLEGGDYFGATS